MQRLKLAQMEPLATFIDRLEHARKLREQEIGSPIRKLDIASAAGVSPSAVTLWYRGGEDGGSTDLKAGPVIALARYLRVRSEWLWDKDGPMRYGQPQEGESIPHARLTGEAQRLIDAIAAADQRGAIPKEGFVALATIVTQMASSGETTNLSTASAAHRLEGLVKQAQPRRRATKEAKG